MLSRPRLIAFTLLAQLFLAYALTDLGALAGYPPGRSLFPVALLLPVLVPLLFRNDRKERGIAGVWTLTIWLTAIAIAIPLRDYSYDGNVYHQEIIAALCNGWTPGKENPSGLEMSLWSRHYAKGLEMAAASIVKTTGLLESGKAVNIILCLIPGFLAYGFCRSYCPAIERKWRILLAIATVCNPVCIMQSLTYYIDFAKYAYTISAIILLIEIFSRPADEHPGGLPSPENAGDGTGRKRGVRLTLWSMLGMIIVMASATKFNAIFEIGTVVFAAIVWLLFRRQVREATGLAIFSALTALVAVLLFGWHPYATNLITAGHPLYPLLGEGAVDIMTGNTPPEFLEGNRLGNFLSSLLSAERLSADNRKGGFGILMFPLLLLSALAIWNGRNRTRGGRLSLYIAIWVLASCFFFEQSWWARYIVQLWILIPQGLFMALATRKGDSGHYRAWTAEVRAMGLLILLSVLYAGGCVLILSARVSLYRHELRTVLKGERVRVYGLMESYRRQMQELGIDPEVATVIDTTCYLVPLYGTAASPDAYPIMLLDSAKGNEIRERTGRLPFDFTPSFERDPKKLPK